MNSVEVVPKENFHAYSQLYVIEVAIRELIIEHLAQQFGALWWKTRIPSDVLSSFKEGRAYEKRLKWYDFIPHHPLYYVEFSDLKKILQRNDNWSQVFQKILGNKDFLTATLTELEPIRNRVAHNRKLSQRDVLSVDSAYAKLSTSIGQPYFLELAKRCTTIDDLPKQISDMHTETQTTFEKLKQCKPVGRCRASEIMQSWWFDEDYINSSVSAIKEYFCLVASYSKLPRHRGSGYKLQRWLTQCDIITKYELACTEFNKLLEFREGK